MVSFGLLSSLFDFTTFAFLLLVVHAAPASFQTAWFVESLMTQLAIVLIVRTHKVFWQSRPSPLLGWLTLGIGVIALLLPYMPFMGWFGFVPLPLPVLAGLVAITGLYLVVSGVTKRWFFEHDSRLSHRHRAWQGVDRKGTSRSAFQQ